jgi:S1-C subfamily serine protease
VIIRHRSNIQRLLKGTEPKIGQKVDTSKTAESGEGNESQKSAEDKGNGGSASAVILLALCLSLFQSALAADTSKSLSKPSAATSTQYFTSAPPAAITPEEATYIKVYKNDSKAVVNVTTTGVATPESLLYGNAQPTGDTGSGSIISADGYILTNNHVVTTTRNGVREVAQLVKITLHDGTAYPAKVVGVDPDNDLAVLKIDPGTVKLATIKFGDSSKLEVGRRVFAIGNPFGLDLTMTSGIISSVGRTMRTENGRVIKGVLQTDAAINPGNSGGPLLDSQGNMIGVTTAILSRVQQSAGIGFAIPINVVKRIVPQLIAHGAVLRPDLGILQVKPTNQGLMVWAIDPAGPAQSAGLQGPTIRRGKVGGFDFQQLDISTADIIVGIDSQQVGSIDDLLSYIETKKPGQVVTLNVLRQGQVTKIPVKLVETKAPN